MSIAEEKQKLAALAITAMLSEFKIGRPDLLKSKFKEHVRFRSIAIKRLHEIGLGYGAIATALGINVSTTRYWLNSNCRKLARRHSRNSYLRSKAKGVVSVTTTLALAGNHPHDSRSDLQP